MFKNLKCLNLCAALLLSLSAKTTLAKDTAADPYETYNRHAFRLNQKLDKVIFKPAATAYRAVLPIRIQQGISNFFSNLDQIPTIINDALQGEGYYAISDTWRFVINSTIGVFGLIDVASRIELPRRQQDFGLTLAKWGYRSSAYLVIPILGPRTVRDATAWPINYYFFSVYPYVNDDTTRYSLITLNVIDTRAQLLDFDQTIKQASFDPYVFQRNAYLQRRNYLINKNAQHHSLHEEENAEDDEN